IFPPVGRAPGDSASVAASRTIRQTRVHSIRGRRPLPDTPGTLATRRTGAQQARAERQIAECERLGGCNPPRLRRAADDHFCAIAVKSRHGTNRCATVPRWSRGSRKAARPRCRPVLSPPGAQPSETEQRGSAQTEQGRPCFRSRSDSSQAQGRRATETLHRGPRGGSPAPGRDPRRQLDSADKRKRVEASGVSDGPFMEAKEVLGGYSLLETATTEEAVEISKTWPGVDRGWVVIEITPVVVQ